MSVNANNKSVRVLELGLGVATAYAAKLLGDQGADVVKVESKHGQSLRNWGPFPKDKVDLEQSGLFLALNVNKRSICLSPSEDGDAAEQQAESGVMSHELSVKQAAEIQSLLSWADILVHDLPNDQVQLWRVDPATLESEHPALVVLSITPFGRTGPYADYVASELILTNAGGWANLCPGTHTDPELAPLKVFGDQCALMAGISGAMAALATLRDVNSSGCGEYIDLSIQEYVASVLEMGVPAYSYRQEVFARFHQRSLIPWGIFQARDAAVFIVCVEEDQWRRLVAFMGNPEWTEIELFDTHAGRADNQDLVHNFVQEFVAQWDALDLYHAAQEHRICVAPVMEMAQLADNEHLQSRSFFTELPTWPAHEGAGSVRPKAAYLAASVLGNAGRDPIHRPAPYLGEHTDEIWQQLTETSAPQSSVGEAKLPLQGVRVLDMTWAWAGPFCTMNLSHLGAEVIRIESEVRPDLYRRLPVTPKGMEGGLNCSGMFNQWNQGKSSLAVDLSTSEGIEIVKGLVKQSDILVQNFATGVMERLGLSYEKLKQINPGIIVASISGYGQTGPYRGYMGYGPAIPPLTGLAVTTGYVGGDAEEIGLSMPDPTAGITAAWAVVAALQRRSETGLGDHLDVSLWEATGVLNMEAWMQYAFNGTQPKRMGNRSIKMSPHGVFRCQNKGSDDEKMRNSWIAIACQNDAQWQIMAQMIDSELARDSRFLSVSARKQNEDVLEQILGAWVVDKDRWELTSELQAHGIAAFPTLTCRDVVEDPHMKERDFIEYLDHPEVGARAHTGIPWRLKNRNNGVRFPAPCIGADTARHLREILGMKDEEIQRLCEAGVVSVS
ncbi:MAG: CoA transferase [Pseudomonadales bacterium]|nr:CoA transferase [Pseudomonadales bacterium]